MSNNVIMLALTGALALSAGCHVNPATGDEELMFFSLDQDVRVGQKYAGPVAKELGGRIPDENLQRYINDVGQRIARVCDQPDLSYHFTAVEDKMVNALALPGGYIFITRGLLKEMKTEGQLAAVLAHEVSHVVARDTMAALSRQLSMTALVAAAAVSGAPGRAVVAADFVSTMLALQYSRDDEREADLTGLSYMTHAGYDPNGIVEAMQILDELQTVHPIEFFSTHPGPESRIAYLKGRIADRYSNLGPLKKGQQEYEEAVLARLKKRKSTDTANLDSPVKPE
jgi:predicted Zn-dependent protease